MSQMINTVGEILKQHCEQDNDAYQTDVQQTEEDSRNTVIKHVRIYVAM